VLRLLALGASPNVISSDGLTPLMAACLGEEDEMSPRLISDLLRASSPATRRVTDPEENDSALDLFVASLNDSPAPWRYGTIREMLAAGVPVKRRNARWALSLAARRADELEAQAAAKPYQTMTWRGHEAMVKLAFDMRDKREAGERARATKRRVEELERELAGRRGQGESGSGSDEEDEDEEGKEQPSGSRGAEEGGSGSGSGSQDESGSDDSGSDDDDDDEDENDDDPYSSDDDDGPWW
jgi:hypothetical protein